MMKARVVAGILVSLMLSMALFAQNAQALY